MKSKIVNKKEIRVAGLQRSGNHAVINWILSQCRGKIYFLNFAQPHTNPFVSAHQNRLLNFCMGYNQKLESRKLSTKDCLVYSYEDDDIPDIFNKEFEINHDNWIGKSAERYDVIIIRDPFNFFASRLKWLENPYKGYAGKIPPINSENIERLISLWKAYAKEYLNETHYLKNNEVAINYNRWFRDKAHREEIAKKLNLKVIHDEKVNELAVFSTFGEDWSKQNALDLGVLERWKTFRDNSDYLKIFKDKELIDLSLKIFGKIPGTENIYGN